MKKAESVLNGYMGWGKPRYVAAFPQIFFGLRSLILSKKFTMKGEGENGCGPEEPNRSHF
jgi:hypothetical protein